MRHDRRRIVVLRILKACWLVGVTVLCCAPDATAEGHRGEIVCREELAKARRDQLTSKLKIISGWAGLKFDEGGLLEPGSDPPVGGSQTARDLITKALSETVLVLEDASDRSDVVFSRVVPGRMKRNTANNLPVFVILIDFADFDHLMGDQQALAAFDVGWGVLHEIDHAVNDSTDADDLGQTGECEVHINQMRRECNLPERLDYFFTLFRQTEESGFRTKWVRLAFEQQDAVTNKHRRYWLIWDANLVGGLDRSRQIAGLRSARS